MPVPTTAATQVVENMPTDPKAQEAVVNSMIARYFSPDEQSLMRKIAECESGREHVEPDGPYKGTLLRNDKGGSARGSFQVLMRVHRKEMFKKGLDPNDPDEYMQYVHYLKRTFGTRPWNPSKHCWG